MTADTTSAQLAGAREKTAVRSIKCKYFADGTRNKYNTRLTCLSLSPEDDKIFKEANNSGKERAGSSRQRVGWIFFLLLIAMLRMAQITNNPSSTRNRFNSISTLDNNEFAHICSSATSQMYAGKTNLAIANEGVFSIKARRLYTTRASEGVMNMIVASNSRMFTVAADGSDAQMLTNADNLNGTHTVSYYESYYNLAQRNSLQLSQGNPHGQALNRHPHGNPSTGQALSRYPHGNPLNGQALNRHPRGNPSTGQASSRYSHGNPLNGQALNRPSDGNPNTHGQALDASSSENAITCFRDITSNVIVLVYVNDSVILGQDNILLDWFIENGTQNVPPDGMPQGDASSSEDAIAHSKNVASNSNVIVPVYVNDCIILDQDNILLDWLIEIESLTYGYGPEKIAFPVEGSIDKYLGVIAYFRNEALNSNVIAIYKGKTNSIDGSVTCGSENSDVKLFGSAQHKASHFCITQSISPGSTQCDASSLQSDTTLSSSRSTPCHTMSLQSDAILFGSAHCNAALFDSTQFDVDVSFIGSIQYDATSFSSIQFDTISLGDTICNESTICRFHSPPRPRLERDSDSIFVTCDMLSSQASSSPSSNSRPSSRSSRLFVSEGGALDDSDFQIPTFLFRDTKCTSFREGEMCIYTYRSIYTQACRCSTSCSLYLYACTRDNDPKSRFSSPTSDGASQHAGHLCSTSCSSNRFYAGKRALESQAHASKSYSSASEGALESKAPDSKVKCYLSARRQRDIQIHQTQQLILQYNIQPTASANFQSTLSSNCALTAKSMQALGTRATAKMTNETVTTTTNFQSHLSASEGAQIQSLPKSKHYSYSTSKEANASESHTSNTSVIGDSSTGGAPNTISFLLSVAITIFTFRTFLPGHVKCFALPAGIARKLFMSKSNRYRFSYDFLTRYTNKYKMQLSCVHNGTHNFSSQQRQLFISQYCIQQIETLILAQKLHQVPYPDTDISGLDLDADQISDFSARGSVRIFSWRTFPLSSSSFFSLK